MPGFGVGIRDSVGITEIGFWHIACTIWCGRRKKIQSETSKQFVTRTERVMIRFDPKNSVNKTAFLKNMQFPSSNGQLLQFQQGPGGQDQHLILSALKEIDEKNEKTAIGVVNALFLSSTSHSLDKVCLNIFAKMGDEKSLFLLYRKYPTPESISISLLPNYIRAIGFLGGASELDLLAKVASTFWGMYRSELISGFDQISQRADNIVISDSAVLSLQQLFEVSDEIEQAKLIAVCSRLTNELLLSIILCGLESPHAEVRRVSIGVLSRYQSQAARHAYRRAFLMENDEQMLDEFDPTLLTAPSTALPS